MYEKRGFVGVFACFVGVSFVTSIDNSYKENRLQ